MFERTLVLLKPDAVQRALVGAIIQRFENVGLKIVAMKLVVVDAEFARKHYAEHVGKKFYKVLEDFLTEGPVVAMVLEGISAVEVVRKLVGSTEPKQSAPGTIRGDYAHHSYAFADSKGSAVRNLIHASDTVDNAKREISLWFNENEIMNYKTVHEMHVF